jgi:hypothetical protein
MYNQDNQTYDIINETNYTTLSLNENRINQYALIQKINNDIYESNFDSDNEFKSDSGSSFNGIYNIACNNNEKKNIKLNLTEFNNNNDN